MTPPEAVVLFDDDERLRESMAELAEDPVVRAADLSELQAALAGQSPVEPAAAVIGPGIADQIALARRIQIRYPGLPLILLCRDEALIALGDRIRTDPALGGAVQVLASSSLATLEAALHEAIDQRRRRMRHHEILRRASEALSRPSRGPAEPRPYIDALVDSVPVGILVLSDELRILTANRWARQTLPSCLEAEGKPLTEVLPEAAMERLRGPDGRPLRGSVQVELPAAGGRPGFFELSWIPSKSIGGSLQALLVQDVTEGRRIEEIRQRAEQMAGLVRIAAGVSHHLNNILASLLGHAELIEESLTAPEARESLRRIYRGIDRAVRLNAHLLGFAGDESLLPRDVALEPLIRDAVGRAGSDAARGLAIETRLGPGAAEVHADPNRLERALDNILQNALEALSGRGTIRVGARPARSIPGHPELGGPFVRVAVVDDGPGMDRETLSRAVEPFFTTGDKAMKQGLGLSLVAGFARQSGGEAVIRSREGRGTIVALYLPAPRRAAADPDRSLSPGP